VGLAACPVSFVSSTKQENYKERFQGCEEYWLICALWRSLRDCSKLPEKVRRLDGVEILACSSQVKLSSLWASLGVNYV
jgi:hypothetical protein